MRHPHPSSVQLISTKPLSACNARFHMCDMTHSHTEVRDMTHTQVKQLIHM